MVFDETNSLVVIVTKKENIEVGDEVTVKRGDQTLTMMVVDRKYMRSLNVLTLAAIG